MVKKPDKPDTDYQHRMKVGVATLVAATLTLTMLIFVLGPFE